MKIRLSILSLFFAFSGSLLTPSVDARETTEAPRDTSNLHIASGSAMLIDLQTNKIIYASNPDVVVPIASVTKLMTGLVVLEAKQNMDEYISVSISDTPEMKGVFSRVKLNSELPRKEMLLITLMSSENRAAASLAHHYPGGVPAFVAAMNAKAKALGMTRTHYVEPTGLSELNVSSANDLLKLLKASQQYPLIGQFSTHPREDPGPAQAQLHPGFSQHQQPGAQAQLEHPADQDRLYQRRRPLPGDAHPDGQPPSGFCGAGRLR